MVILFFYTLNLIQKGSPLSSFTFISLLFKFLHLLSYLGTCPFFIASLRNNCNLLSVQKQ